MLLIYQANEVSVRQRLDLTYTTLPLHRQRVWLICPRCESRIRAVHCPPGQSRFYCRACHDLAYASSQKAHDDRHALRDMIMPLVLLERRLELLARLSRPHQGSKRNRRLLAKLNALNTDLEQVIPQRIADLESTPVQTNVPDKISTD